MMLKYNGEDRGIKIIELENSYQMCTKEEYYDYLGIIGRNSWRWLVSFCGIFQAGAVAVLLDRELDPKMIGKLAERVELAAICYDDSAEEKIRAAGLSETVKRIPMGEKTEKIRNA